jgi:hypothetical protein
MGLLLCHVGLDSIIVNNRISALPLREGTKFR